VEAIDEEEEQQLVDTIRGVKLPNILLAKNTELCYEFRDKFAQIAFGQNHTLIVKLDNKEFNNLLAYKRTRVVSLWSGTEWEIGYWE
jgi:hypothetical protein